MNMIAKTMLGAFAAFALMACGNGEKTARSGQTVTSGTADLGGAFSLVNQNGDRVTEADLQGKPHLIYFGFTYCPDVCPTALQKMGQAQSMLGSQADDIGYVLISVDPERDTVESLSQYVTASGFPTGLKGFTGTVEEIEVAKAAYKVYATKVDTPDSAGEYTVDHSDIMYLMDKDGQYADYFSGRSTPTMIAARVTKLLKSGK
ncbi:protein SCO1/2 [Litorimonas taeanensis]|uniref:Protein SCO1/2 n=1 Tax=Litorimonas taeanensis TaxID=568099 RepID=A0A420WF41_9PROT|nr:SCO family protein [Litorimonas taeanensis]RKQ69601.1 protein SCO1/2 [Litorimonas taeanensis]